jgi:hypothetical protein
MATVIVILIICKSSIIYVFARRRPYVNRERIEMFDFLSKYFLPKHFLLGSHKYGWRSEIRDPEKTYLGSRSRAQKVSRPYPHTVPYRGIVPDKSSKGTTL